MLPISDSIEASHFVSLAVQKIHNLGLRCLPVTYEGKVIGLLSHQDIIQQCAGEELDLSTSQVRDFMRAGRIACQENQSINDAIQQMDQMNSDHLIVLNESGQVVGLIARDDIIANYPSLDFDRS